MICRTSTWTVEKANSAGLVGNLMAESGVMSDRIEGSRPQSPMTARDFSGRSRTFTPEEVRDRNFKAKQGPKLPGIGLAQWTTKSRRDGLFNHTYQGKQLGTAILSNLDAQVDYLVTELKGSYSSINDSLLADGTANDASDNVVYGFEVPGAILANKKKLPRSDPRVQAVFAQRRANAGEVLKIYNAAQAAANKTN